MTNQGVNFQPPPGGQFSAAVDTPQLPLICGDALGLVHVPASSPRATVVVVDSRGWLPPMTAHADRAHHSEVVPTCSTCWPFTGLTRRCVRNPGQRRREGGTSVMVGEWVHSATNRVTISASSCGNSRGISCPQSRISSRARARGATTPSRSASGGNIQSPAPPTTRVGVGEPAISSANAAVAARSMVRAAPTRRRGRRLGPGTPAAGRGWDGWRS